MRWLAKAMTLLQERARGNKVTKKVASRPLRAATLQLRHNIVASLANSLDLLSQQQRPACDRTGSNGTHIVRRSAAQRARADQSARPVNALGRWFRPHRLRNSPSWQPVLMQARPSGLDGVMGPGSEREAKAAVSR